MRKYLSIGMCQLKDFGVGCCVLFAIFLKSYSGNTGQFKGEYSSQIFSELQKVIIARLS